MKILCGIVAVVFLAGCSTSSPPDEKIATLESPGAPQSAPSKSGTPEEERPRERLDMTVEEKESMQQVWLRCLDTHGVTKRVMDQDPSAKAVCLPKEPLPPWEYDPANPESSDFVHRLVQCLRRKGVKEVDEVPAEGGGDRNTVSFGRSGDSGSITKGLDLTPVCEKELAATGAK
jgi:hypothetical protein